MDGWMEMEDARSQINSRQNEKRERKVVSVFVRAPILRTYNE